VDAVELDGELADDAPEGDLSGRVRVWCVQGGEDGVGDAVGHAR
jgi:hypothetical protein